MAFPSSIYAPPSVYTKTNFDSPLSGALAGVKIPVLIGTGSEILSQSDLELVRGSSSSVDQQIVQEDMSGRIVASELASGEIVLGSYDGTANQVQVRNFPIVTGDGSGTTTTKPSDVSVSLNGEPVVVLAIDGARGLLTLSESPKIGDSLKVTYFFNRTDTLTTDDVSAQVSEDSALIYLAKAGNYKVFPSSSDVLLLTVDGVSLAITLVGDASNEITAASLVTQIKSGAGVTSLDATTYTNNEGNTSVALSADKEIVVGSGSANSSLGLSAGTSTGRNKTFYVFNGPIVDGSNGGVTTTDVADVTVKVDGVQVIPSSVDGFSRAVTLSVPPANGSTVTIQYYFNTWQDTFDYLAHTGITEVTLAGFSAGKGDFIQGVDFILKDDKILWGTGVIVETSVSSQGYSLFGENQITANLVDNKGYLEPCSAIVDTSVSPAKESKTEFKLPFIPTTGNGRGTPIGISLFQTVSNGRIDLPTNRPDLVKAYWGFSIQDALDRGEVAVLSVDHESASITLRDPVPTGAMVWATQYYNVIQDSEYSVVCETAGVSGVGTYSISDKSGSGLVIPQFVEKSAGLATVTIEFPSGSELLSDVRYETPHNTKSFSGAVEEEITVTFSDKAATPAAHTFSSTGEFAFIDGQSSVIEITVDGGATPTDLQGVSHQAYITGAELVYPDPTAQSMLVSSGIDDSLIMTVDGQQVEITLSAGTQTMTTLVGEINAAVASVLPRITGVAKFTSSFDIVAGENDNLTITVDVTPYALTLAAASYPTASALVAEIQTQIDAAGLGEIHGTTGTDVKINANVDSFGQVFFTYERITLQSKVVLSSTNELLKQLGLDGSEVMIGDGVGDYKVAELVSMPAIGGNYFYDRIVLRNRILPASALGEAQASVMVDVTTADDILGLSMAQAGEACSKATVEPANVYGEVGLTGSQASADGAYPQVTLYPSGSTNPQNNILLLTIDGTTHEVVFTQKDGTALTESGHDVPLSDTGVDKGIVEQINDQVGSAVASIEGHGIRISSLSQGTESSVVIGEGSSNSILGLLDNTSASRDLVSISCLASALIEQGISAHFSVISDSAGTDHLYMQSQTTGVSSNISYSDGTLSLIGTGFTDSIGDGGVGESGKSGFYVTSNISNGSGSVATSLLSGTGVGQDGVVGQTYRDLATGLTFTVLPRKTGVNYPAGTLTFKASKIVTTDANLPVSTVKGVSLIVANTESLNAGDSASVETFQRSGEQPEVGDTYYSSYKYAKQDFTPRLYTKFNAVEAAFGELDPTNPLTLACYLAMTNGSILVGLKQVKKDELMVNGEYTQASVVAYRDAVDEMGGTFASGTTPDILVPLRGDSLELYQYMARHANIQSSIRYKSERTVIAGVGAGTKRKDVQAWAGAIKETRFRLLYPDMAYLTITDAFGNDQRHLVDGTFVAAAWAGSIVAPTKDVATPWTNSRIFGFDSLARTSDAVQKNQLAVAGITVLEDIPNALKVRHGLTTDMSNIVTKTPTVIQIADEVQQLARTALDSFVGVKFLPSITSQIEGKLAMVLKELVRKDIIAGYTGITANVNPDDPTVAEISAAYQPVFPLLYLVVTFNLRASL